MTLLNLFLNTRASWLSLLQAHANQSLVEERSCANSEDSCRSWLFAMTIQTRRTHLHTFGAYVLVRNVVEFFCLSLITLG